MTKLVLLTLVAIALAGCTSPAADTLADADTGPVTTDPPVSDGRNQPAAPLPASSAQSPPSDEPFTGTLHLIANAVPCDGGTLSLVAPTVDGSCGGRPPFDTPKTYVGPQVTLAAGTAFEVLLYAVTDAPGPTTVTARLLVGGQELATYTWDFLASGGGGIDIGPRESADKLPWQGTIASGASGELSLEVERIEGLSFWVETGPDQPSSIVLSN